MFHTNRNIGEVRRKLFVYWIYIPQKGKDTIALIFVGVRRMATSMS